MTEMLRHFHFLRPWWLLLAVPPLMVAGLRLFGSRRSQQWDSVIAAHLLPHLLSRPSRSRWWSPDVVLLPFSLVVAAAMAGPTYRLADIPNGPDDTTLIVVVDLSKSMAGRDIGPSRIGRLRLKLRDLIELRRGSRIGIVAVAGSAHVVMPPTDDGDALIPYIDVLDPALMPSDGEAFGAVPPLIEGLLKDHEAPTVVLVAADSIPPDGARALGALMKHGIDIVGWTVGTDAGAPAAGVPGVDRSGFSTLERSGAVVMDLSLGDGDVRRIDTLLDNARTARVDPKNSALWDDVGYGLAFIGALGALFWFRRGWVIGRLSVGALLLSLTGCSASGPERLWWDLWLTPDQQGRWLFEQGKYVQAAQRFEDAMWKGTAYYAAQDWHEAEAQFARVDTAEGLFNRANANAQAGQIASAIAAYDQALERRPTYVAARRNRDYFQELLSGLEQTTDFDELKRPDPTAADPTKAKLRNNQLQGPRDLAAEASKEQEHKKGLSSGEQERWMKRVATNPAEFLRAKFATVDARSAQ